MKFAVIGCGFWSNFQISAWGELKEVELVAVCDSNLERAMQVAKKFKVKSVYQSVDELLESENLDFIDIISGVDSHFDLIRKAATNRVPVICQKPMAMDLKTAQIMVNFCQELGVPFFVHENFRWQRPIRMLKEIINKGTIGEIFKAKISFCTGYPVYKNQPYLAKIEKLIVADLGIHLLDVSRFLLGEMRSIHCLLKTVNKGIKGEDVANILMETEEGTHCFIEMSFSSILEEDHFPQTFIMLEGEDGSIYLGPDYRISITTSKGTYTEQVDVNKYSWADPDYAVAHASIVETNRDILNALRGRSKCETTGEDNLKTLKLVHGAYEAAKDARIVSLTPK